MKNVGPSAEDRCVGGVVGCGLLLVASVVAHVGGNGRAWYPQKFVAEEGSEVSLDYRCVVVRYAQLGHAPRALVALH